jgi:hypothetical protein
MEGRRKGWLHQMGRLGGSIQRAAGFVMARLR